VYVNGFNYFRFHLYPSDEVSLKHYVSTNISSTLIMNPLSEMYWTIVNCHKQINLIFRRAVAVYSTSTLFVACTST
jgi:hypothetical protein